MTLPQYSWSLADVNTVDQGQKSILAAAKLGTIEKAGNGNEDDAGNGIAGQVATTFGDALRRT